MRERGRHAEEDLARAGRQVAEHLLRRRRLRGERRRRAVRRSSSTRARSARPAAAFSSSGPIYKNVLDAMVEKAKRITLGPGIDRATKMGPLVSREQFERVRDVSGDREARGEAGRRRRRGRRGAALERGLFVEPTIFYDVDNAARIAREEIFGPVAAVIPFDDEEDAHSHRQRLGLRARRGGVDARHLPRDAHGEAAARRHRLGEPHAADVTSKRRGAATSRAASAASSGRGASRSTCRSSRCTSTSTSSRSAGIRGKREEGSGPVGRGRSEAGELAGS